MRFFGILPVRRKEMRTKLIRIPREDRESLAEDVDEERKDFLSRESKPFDPGYKLEDDEVFKIENFTLPDHLVWAAQNAENCGDLQRAEIKPQTVKAVAGISLEGANTAESSEVRVATFKSLTRSQILDASRKVFQWTLDTFERRSDPSLIIPEGLDAVYSEGSLYFKTFRKTNGFLDLTGEFQELTNEAVQGVLDGVGWLSYQDEDVPLEKVLNQTNRRLFSLINATEDFAELGLDLVKNKALDLGFPFRTTSGEDGDEVMLLPSSSIEMKAHLEFLLQRFYPGIFDGRLRRSNSSEVVGD